MPVWNYVGPSKILNVAKVSRGTQHGYCKEINYSEILAYHFAEILNVQTPRAEIGFVGDRPMLITSNCDVSCCDLEQAFGQHLDLGTSLDTACTAFPLVSWLAYGDHIKLENWVRDVCSGSIKVMPIDFEHSLISTDDIISTNFPRAFTRDKILIEASVSVLERLADGDIKEPMRNFNFSRDQIDAALSRREKMRGAYKSAGLIE